MHTVAKQHKDRASRSLSQAHAHQVICLIFQNDCCQKLNCLSHTFSLQYQFPPLQLCVRTVNVCMRWLCVLTRVCISERWSQRERCKFSLAITLRRAMLRSTQSANEKILTQSVLWMRRHVCEVHTHTLRLRIRYSDVIQSHRAAEAVVTRMPSWKTTVWQCKVTIYTLNLQHAYSIKCLI